MLDAGDEITEGFRRVRQTTAIICLNLRLVTTQAQWRGRSTILLRDDRKQLINENREVAVWV